MGSEPGCSAGWGAAVIDADALARDAMAPGEGTLGPIRARFGDVVFAADGSLDRARWRASCSRTPPRSPTWRRSCTPACASWWRPALEVVTESGAPVAVIEAIKLVEGGLADRCDEVWLVDCPEDVQRARLADRGMAADDIDRRIAAQSGLRERLAPRVTRTLDTSGTLGEIQERVEEALAAALAGTVDILPSAPSSADSAFGRPMSAIRTGVPYEWSIPVLYSRLGTRDSRPDCRQGRVRSFQLITSVTSATIAATSDVAGWAAVLSVGGALLVIGLLIALELLGTGPTRFHAGLRTALKIAVSPLFIVFAVSVAAKAFTALAA